MLVTKQFESFFYTMKVNENRSLCSALQMKVSHIGLENIDRFFFICKWPIPIKEFTLKKKS